MLEQTQTFWDYSLALYGHCEVERCCLALQDRCAANVNLLLLCCWCGARGLEPGDEWFRKLQASLELQQWREQTIAPLRELRRQLKTSAIPGAQSLREKVKVLELEAEKSEQDCLLQWLPPANLPLADPGPLLAWRNLQAYWQSLGRAGLSFADIAPLLGAAYPGYSDVELRRLFTV